MFFLLYSDHRLNHRSQLGSKYGTWLLERQLTPKYGYIGSNKEGTYATFI